MDGTKTDKTHVFFSKYGHILILFLAFNRASLNVIGSVDLNRVNSSCLHK